jgi:hypothetical protein
VAVGFSRRSNKANMARSQQKKRAAFGEVQRRHAARSIRQKERESLRPVQSRVPGETTLRETRRSDWT